LYREHHRSTYRLKLLIGWSSLATSSDQFVFLILNRSNCDTVSFAREDEGGGLIDLNGSTVLNGFLLALPPLIHRHGLLIVASHDAPIAVGLAADHDDVNLVRLEHFYHFIRRRF